MDTKQKCYNHAEHTHAGEDTRLHEVVSNELGRRIMLCSGCVSFRMKVKECGLCDKLCVGATLAVKPHPYTVDPTWTGSKVHKEVFCYECTELSVPKFLSDRFKNDRKAENRVFNEYYAGRGWDNRIDFSTPDSICIAGKHRRGVPNKMSCLGRALYEISTYEDQMHLFLTQELIPALREQRIREGCPVQIARQQRVDEGVGVIERFIPAARGHRRAVELLHPRYIRGSKSLPLEKMRDTNDFDSLLAFLRG